MKELKELKKKLKSEFGNKCKDYCDGCIQCRVWRAYDVLEDAFIDLDILQEHESKITK